MNKLAAILLAAFLLIAATDTPQEKYIRKYADIAVSEMARTGVPASITLAQGLVESAAGQSTLATKAHNHFGIKCHKNWKGGRTYRDDDAANECFRVYRTDEESFRDHSDFLRYYDRYSSLFELKPTDYKGWAHGLKKAGYATDKNYPAKLIKVIEDYQLYRYDGGQAVPETPKQVEKATEVLVEAKAAAEVYKFSLARPLYEKNGVPCIYSVKGESYESIARANHLFLKEILRINDLSADSPLEPGTVVYLQAKKKRAAKGMEKHVMAEGETMRDVAQRFGVRLSSILKINGLDASYTPSEGDIISLR